jgi:UDP-N-acetylmuramate dehydrogenase
MAGGAALEAARIFGDRARLDHPLGLLTTYRVGGPAGVFVTLDGEGDVALAIQAVKETAVDVLVVGRGSNLLVADSGFPGMVLTLGPCFSGIDVEGTIVRAGGGSDLPVLARRTAGDGLRGLEWAVGVPGSVGGGVRMNAGGHGSDIAARLVRVRVLDLATGQDEVVEARALSFGYRRSAVMPTQVVLWAEFGLEAGDPDAARAEVAAVVRWRRAHQPGGQNAGSIFTNPPGDAAGRLVEAAGCKGLRWGTAQVSTKHGNFIQSEPRGSAGDVAALIAEVRRRVADATGFDLKPEVRQVGFPRGPEPGAHP